MVERTYTKGNIALSTALFRSLSSFPLQKAMFFYSHSIGGAYIMMGNCHSPKRPRYPIPKLHLSMRFTAHTTVLRMSVPRG